MGSYDRNCTRDEDAVHHVGLRKIIVVLSLCAAMVASLTYLAKELRRFKKSVVTGAHTSADAPSKHQKLLKISPLDLNLATHEELQLLPHVTEEMATEILAQRPIKTVEQLDDVYGIGVKKLASIRPHVFVDSETLEQRYPDSVTRERQSAK